MEESVNAGFSPPCSCKIWPRNTPNYIRRLLSEAKYLNTWFHSLNNLTPCERMHFAKTFSRKPLLAFLEKFLLLIAPNNGCSSVISTCGLRRLLLPFQSTQYPARTCTEISDYGDFAGEPSLLPSAWNHRSVRRNQRTCGGHALLSEQKHFGHTHWHVPW